MRIMIVEDEAVIALDLEAMLAEAGHAVVGTAASMADAVALAAKRKPEAAVVDIGLHGAGDGLETARALKLPVLFLTGDPGFYVRAMALDIEPIGYVAKPFRAADVLAPLEQFEAAAGSARRRVSG